MIPDPILIILVPKYDPILINFGDFGWYPFLRPKTGTLGVTFLPYIWGHFLQEIVKRWHSHSGWTLLNLRPPDFPGFRDPQKWGSQNGPQKSGFFNPRFYTTAAYNWEKKWLTSSITFWGTPRDHFLMFLVISGNPKSWIRITCSKPLLYHSYVITILNIHYISIVICIHTCSVGMI